MGGLVWFPLARSECEALDYAISVFERLGSLREGGSVRKRDVLGFANRRIGALATVTLCCFRREDMVGFDFDPQADRFVSIVSLARFIREKSSFCTPVPKVREVCLDFRNKAYELESMVGRLGGA